MAPLSKFATWLAVVVAVLSACAAEDDECKDYNNPTEDALEAFGVNPAKDGEDEGCDCSKGTDRASIEMDSIRSSRIYGRGINDIAPTDAQEVEGFSDEDGLVAASSPTGERNVKVPPSKRSKHVEFLVKAAQAGKFNRRLVQETPLVTIPAGEFTMGTDDPKVATDGESPARRVYVSEFLLDQYEVSNRQFLEFVLDTGFKTEAEQFGWSFCFEKTLSPKVRATVQSQVAAVPWWVPVTGADWLRPQGEHDVVQLGRLDYPVVHVSHNDARAYCKWRDARLPREAEFERAVRGGLEQKGYPWGDELYPGGKFRANLWQGTFPEENLAEDGYDYACPVTAFGPQNKFGLYNIIGNAWEWVADAWTTRHRTVAPDGGMIRDPQVELSMEKLEDPTVERVKKGGSYMCHISYCYRYRTASRSSNSADSSAQNLGFRCAKDIEQEEDEEN